MGKGQALYKKAKKLIPGGTQLLSKRPEVFLPDFWPAYYKKAKSCEIWDLEQSAAEHNLEITVSESYPLSHFTRHLRIRITP